MLVNLVSVVCMSVWSFCFSWFESGLFGECSTTFFVAFFGNPLWLVCYWFILEILYLRVLEYNKMFTYVVDDGGC